MLNRICLIGVSGYASVYYDYLVSKTSAGALSIVAASLINQADEPEKCAKLKALGCMVYVDYREMLRDMTGKADMCMVPTGIGWHEPMCVAALKAGMHVLIEKPAAGTIQEVDTMIEAEKSTGRFVAVGFQHMYMHATMLMKDMIMSGKLGKIQMIKAMSFWPRDKEYFTRNGWCGHLKADDKWVLDSPIQNGNAHEINLACFLAGQLRENSATVISVRAELSRVNPIDTADTVSLRLETAENIPILFHGTHASESTVDPVLVIRGEKGTLTWHYHRSLTLIPCTGDVQVLPVETGEQCRERMMNTVLNKITAPETFVCSLEHARQQVLVVNAAFSSCPISTVPSEYVRVTGSGDREYRFIAGIDNLMINAFYREQLLGECGVDWIKTGATVNVKNYSRFNGCN